MRHRTLIVFLLLTIFLFGITAQEKELVVDRYPNALGVQLVTDYGDIILGGLSYQRWMGKIGTQILGGALINNDGSFWYTVLGSLQYRLFSSDFADWYSGSLYLNGALGHSADYNSDQGDGLSTEISTLKPKIHAGFGVGIENVFLGHLSYSLEFMYLATYNLSPSVINPLTLGFAFGTSLRYRY